MKEAPGLCPGPFLFLFVPFLPVERVKIVTGLRKPNLKTEAIRIRCPGTSEEKKTMLDVGTKFPDFSLKNQNGIEESLKDFAGKWLVLYVYPKDDTPGCTIENKGFSATREAYEKANIKVVGLSADDVESHKNFCNKYSLAVDLLADPEAKLLKKLEIGQSEYKGVKYWNRTTFVVDPNGVLRRVYLEVKPEGHEQQILKDIQGLQARH